jgi:hypothetical protein
MGKQLITNTLVGQLKVSPRVFPVVDRLTCHTKRVSELSLYYQLSVICQEWQFSEPKLCILKCACCSDEATMQPEEIVAIRALLPVSRWIYILS